MDTKTATGGAARHALVPTPAGTFGRWRGRPGLTLLTVAVGVMMVALDGTIIAVANPAIQSHLHASLAGIQWVSNAYLLALAVSLITIGRLGDRFGHKKVFLTGVAGFAASSAAIGLSGSIAGSVTLVIAFRALQGVFGAMLQPTALALLRNTFPAEKWSRSADAGRPATTYRQTRAEPPDRPLPHPVSQADRFAPDAGGARPARPVKVWRLPMVPTGAAVPGTRSPARGGGRSPRGRG